MILNFKNFVFEMGFDKNFDFKKHYISQIPLKPIPLKVDYQATENIENPLTYYLFVLSDKIAEEILKNNFYFNKEKSSGGNHYILSLKDSKISKLYKDLLSLEVDDNYLDNYKSLISKNLNFLGNKFSEKEILESTIRGNDWSYFLDFREICIYIFMDDSIHFVLGLPESLQGMKLTYHLYKNLLMNNKIDIVISTSSSKSSIQSIWRMLLNDKDLCCCLINNSCIGCFSKNNSKEQVEYALKRIKETNWRTESVEVYDDEFKEILKKYNLPI